MLRIYKSYRLPYRIGGRAPNATQPVAAQHMTFPSYPAVPFSLDDFYQTSAGMVPPRGACVWLNTGTQYPLSQRVVAAAASRAAQVITETTINNNNRSLWERLSPGTLLDWARNMVANRLAGSGDEWMSLYSKHNSGT